MAYAINDDDETDLVRFLAYDLGDTSISRAPQNDLAQRYARSPRLGGAPKRALDIAIALLALIFFAPLMLALALAVWLQGDGPVFYRQTRIGFEGRPFACLKFRSMVANSAERLEQFLKVNPIAKAEWSATHKLRDDPRITPLGKFLRKSSLDELPQLFNIICGDMSVVGPRPIVAAEMAHYGDLISFYLQCRPGLTGRWQISGRSDTGYQERVELDVEYVKEWSVFKDTVIMLKTVPAVLTTRGSY